MLNYCMYQAEMTRAEPYFLLQNITNDAFFLPSLLDSMLTSLMIWGQYVII